MSHPHADLSLQTRYLSRAPASSAAAELSAHEVSPRSRSAAVQAPALASSNESQRQLPHEMVSLVFVAFAVRQVTRSLRRWRIEPVVLR